jgi:hypothetical protein
MRQDQGLFRPTRNLPRLVGIDSLGDLACTATYRLKKCLISEHHG